MTAAIQLPLPLPVLPDAWSGGDQNFKVVSSLSRPIDRAIEPVGPYFLAHARRKRYKRTFSEDERIQAQQNVKKVEDDDDGEISEDEDPLMLGRDAKDWKVCHPLPPFTNLPRTHVALTTKRFRVKTITPSSVSPSTATKRLKIRSSAPTAKRSSSITRTKRPLPAPPTMTTSSSASNA